MKTKKHIKEKLIIAGIGKFGSENFIRIKARKRSFAIPELVDSFLYNLGFSTNFCDKSFARRGKWIDTKANYKDNIGTHNFLENSKYKVHVIFDENYLYLIIKTYPNNREDMTRKLMKYSKWEKIKK